MSQPLLLSQNQNRENDSLPLVGFQGAVVQAPKEGDLTFALPVVHGVDREDDEPGWEPLPLKTLKELQSAVKSMGLSAPYTIQIVDMVASQWLTPPDWHQTAKATLSPGDYVLWRTEYEERSKATLNRLTFTTSKRKEPKLTMDMLLGTGAFMAPHVQVSIPKAIVKDITTNAVLAWRAIPPLGTKGTTLSGIRQANEETYESFISRLEECCLQVKGQLLLKQLAWEIANQFC